MSRIGKMPIGLPSGVTAAISGPTVTVKGPRGELTRSFNPEMKIEHRDGSIVVERPNDERRFRALHGLTRTLINNMVIGVNSGYEKSLEIVGVGYRATQAGEKVVVQVGYSRPVEVTPLPGIQLEAQGQNRINVRGIEKERVGLMAAQIRAVRPPDRYKGKGIRYAREVVLLRPGKGGKKAR